MPKSQLLGNLTQIRKTSHLHLHFRFIGILFTSGGKKFLKRIWTLCPITFEQKYELPLQQGLSSTLL
jgi:hypothetical protein